MVYTGLNPGSNDTGISSNSGYGGKTVLCICSSNTSSADNTYSSIYIVRCAYNINTIHVTRIDSDKNTNFDFSVSETTGNIVIHTYATGGRLLAIFN